MSVTEKLKDKRVIVLIAVCLAMLIALIPIVISIVNNLGDRTVDTPDTGETLSGHYSMNVSSGAHSGSSGYTFEGDKATLRYNAGGEEVVEKYSYVIAVQNGIKVIKFTLLDEAGKPTSETTAHEFYTGSFDGREFISINESYYYKQ